MPVEWWQMPGPAAWINLIARDLEAGQCVVVGLPEFAPPFFRQALRRVVERPAAPREWHQIESPTIAPQLPAAWLWEQWRLDEGQPCPPGVNATNLLQHPAVLQGCIWELPSLKTSEIDIWLTFLYSYQQALQQVSQMKRSVLLIIVEEALALPQLPHLNQPQLTFHRYRYQQTRLDMLLFLSRMLSPAVVLGCRPIERELRIQTAAALFPSDPIIALHIAEMWPLEPSELSKKILFWQQERGWHSDVMPSHNVAEKEWARGWICEVDGQAEAHLCTPTSASLASRIQQSLWLAQIRVLLPWMEQQRWRLLHLPELKNYFSKELKKKPYERTYPGRLIVIHEPEKLEPTYMLDVLNRISPFRPSTTSFLHSQKLRDQLTLLRDCRNALSHLAPLSESQVSALVNLSD